jgi:alkyl hydroperoxide reductase subunit AhpF
VLHLPLNEQETEGDMYDLAIIGGGSAALSAAVYDGREE